MPSLTQLGQQVKAKYPGQYDDIPDDQLGAKIQAKFPGAYDDYTAGNSSPSGLNALGGLQHLGGQSTSQPAASKVSNTLASIMDNTVGGGTWAKTLGTLAAGNTKSGKDAQASQANLQAMQQKLLQAAQGMQPNDPRRVQLLQQIQNNSRILGDNADQTLQDLPTAKKFLASGAQLALSAATMGAPSGAAGDSFQLASKAAPSVGAVAAPIAQSLRSRVLQSGLQGLAS